MPIDFQNFDFQACQIFFYYGLALIINAKKVLNKMFNLKTVRYKFIELSAKF